MVMVDVVTSGLQADLRLKSEVYCQLGPKVGGHLALFCIRRVNRRCTDFVTDSWSQHREYYSGIIIFSSSC